MAEQKFDIIFKSETLDGVTIFDAQANLAKLFKQPTEIISKQFFSQPCYLKKSLNRETAAKYQAALKKAGLKIYIREQQSESNKAEEALSTKNQPTDRKPSVTEESYGFALAPMEGLLLKPSERKPSIINMIDLSAYSLTAQKGYLVDPQELTPKDYPLIKIPDFNLVPMER